MKKIRTILTGILLILTLSIFTACGNNNAPADEAGTATEENTTDTGTNENADAVNDKKDNENTDNSNNKVTKTIISTNLSINDIFKFYEERIGSGP